MLKGLLGGPAGRREGGRALLFVAGDCSVAGAPMWSELGPAIPGHRASGWRWHPRRSPPSAVLFPVFHEAEIKSHAIHRKTLTTEKLRRLECSWFNTKAVPFGCETAFFKTW